MLVAHPQSAQPRLTRAGKLALLLIALLPQLAKAEFSSKSELFFNAGDMQSYGGARMLLALGDFANSGLFVDARVALSNANLYSYSLGGLYRFLNADAALYGLYLGVDASQSRNHNYHQQVTLGAERLGKLYDLRALAYIPFNSEYQTDKFDSSTESKTEFYQHQLQQRITAYNKAGYVLEEALAGGSFEVGRLVPSSTRLDMRAYLGAYAYTSTAFDTFAGGSVRLNAQPTDNFNINISAKHDKIFKTRMSLDVAFAFGRRAHNSGVRSPAERGSDYFARDNSVLETSKLDKEARKIYIDGSAAIGSSAPVANAPQYIAHIDNSASTAGDGSFEKPYQSIAQCQLGSCKTADAIFIHQGKSVELKDGKRSANQNNTTPYQGNISLNKGQQLLGDGIKTGMFAPVSTGYEPVLIGSAGSGANAIISTSADNHIMGLRLGWYFGVVDAPVKSKFVDLPTGGAMPDYGIKIVDSDNVSISDVVLTGFTKEKIEGSYAANASRNFKDGVFIKGNSDVSIATSVITAALDNGINMQASSDNTQALRLRGVNLVRNGRGVNIYADGSNITQNFNVFNYKRDKLEMPTVIEANNNEGILLLHSKGSTATAQLKIDNASIDKNLGTGIFVDFAQNQGASNKSSLKINNSQILRNSGGVGVISNEGSTSIDIDSSIITGNLEGLANLDASYGTNLGEVAYVGAAKLPQLAGIGLYFKNQSTGKDALQSINISGNSFVGMHDKDRAQIYLQSAVPALSTSNQSISMDAASRQNISNIAGKIALKTDKDGFKYYDLVKDEGSIAPVLHFDGVADGKAPQQKFDQETQLLLSHPLGQPQLYSSERDLGLVDK